MTEIQIYQQQEIQKAGIIPPKRMPQTAEQALTISLTLPEPYYNSIKPKEIKDAINSITPEISLYRKHSGETKARALIVLFLSDLVKFFNVGKAMNDIQMAQTADLILDEYYDLNFDDFKLCFNMAKSGKFGKVYDRLDGQVIMDWLSTYKSQRVQLYVNENLARHESIKAGERTGESYLEILSKNRL